MRGIRFSVLLAIPFILAASFLLYMIAFQDKENWIWTTIPFLLILILIYVTHPQIDYWYHKKYPPSLDPPIIYWLNRFFPFYLSLDVSNRKKFEERLALYLNGRAFHLMLKEKDKIPEDFKAMIAAHCIQMSFEMKDFLLGNYDRIICYNHPFPTPANQFLHTVEVHHEDGVILLSIEQLMAAIGDPERNYNIAYHAYSDALLHNFPQLRNLTQNDKSVLEKLEQIFPFTMQHIQDLTGFNDLDLNILSFASYFAFSEKFRTIWPEQFHFYNTQINDLS